MQGCPVVGDPCVRFGPLAGRSIGTVIMYKVVPVDDYPAYNVASSLVKGNRIVNFVALQYTEST